MIHKVTKIIFSTKFQYCKSKNCQLQKFNYQCKFFLFLIQFKIEGAQFVPCAILWGVNDIRIQKFSKTVKTTICLTQLS